MSHEQNDKFIDFIKDHTRQVVVCPYCMEIKAEGHCLEDNFLGCCSESPAHFNRAYEVLNDDGTVVLEDDILEYFTSKFGK